MIMVFTPRAVARGRLHPPRPDPRQRARPAPREFPRHAEHNACVMFTRGPGFSTRKGKQPRCPARMPSAHPPRGSGCSRSDRHRCEHDRRHGQRPGAPTRTVARTHRHPQCGDVLDLVKGSRLRRRCAPLTRPARAAALVLSTGEERSAGSRGDGRAGGGAVGAGGQGASMVEAGSARAEPSHVGPGAPSRRLQWPRMGKPPPRR